MSNGDWFLMAVVAVAFIAGYSIVSFVVKRMKSVKQPTDPTGDQSRRRSETWESQSEAQKHAKEQEEQARKEEEREQEERHRREQEDRREREQDKRKAPHTGDELEKQYGRVLGLQGQVAPADVKRRYRELVAQYHPDKVNHLGPKLKVLAEKEIKIINEAYAYFEKKYGM